MLLFPHCKPYDIRQLHIVFVFQSSKVFFTFIADVFEPFLRSYLKKFQYETVTTKEWRHYLEEYFHDKVNDCTCKV